MKITTYTTCDEIYTDDDEWVGLVDRGDNNLAHLKRHPAKQAWRFTHPAASRARAITREELDEAAKMGAERVKLRNLTDRMLK